MSGETRALMFVTEPDAVMVQLQASMTLGEWKQVRVALQECKGEQSPAFYGLLKEIADTVDRVERVFEAPGAQAAPDSESA